MPGPLPTPTALRLLKGNPGKRATNKQEPDPAYLSDLTAPAWLPENAARVWDEIVPGLARAKLLTEVDVPLLASGCVALAQFRLAAQKTGVELLKTPADDADDDSEKPAKAEYLNPWLVVQSMTFKQAITVLREFGMSPAARTRIAIQPQAGLFDGKEKDPYFT
jgi:P27 family predicted phage terminase small subunit